jgi:RNA polymerase sporulation-specific sigma factor
MKIRFINDIKEFLLRLKLKYFCENVYYINSPQMLPPPLKKAEEQELTERIANGDEKAREPLIVHNLRLVVYIAKKFESSGVNIEDLVSIGTIGLIKGVSTFKAEKGSRLATYAARCIENEILMYFRSAKRRAQDVRLSDPIDTDKDGNALTLSDILSDDTDIVDTIDKRIKLSKLSDVIDTVLDKREKMILEFRYGLNGKTELTQHEIAKKFGISRSYVSRIEKSALTKLKPYF